MWRHSGGIRSCLRLQSLQSGRNTSSKVKVPDGIVASSRMISSCDVVHQGWDSISRRHSNKMVRCHRFTYRGFSSRRNMVSLDEMTMPALSPTMEMGTLVAWKKQEGESLNPGDVLCQVETDKATVDYELQDEAVLAKILIPEGTVDIPVGTLLAYTVEDEEAYKAFVAGGQVLPHPASSSNRGSVATHTSAVVQDSMSAMESATLNGGRKAHLHPQRTPLIKFVGKRSLRNQDVLEGVKAVAAASKSPLLTTATIPKPALVMDSNATYTDIPLSNMRKVIAKRLQESKKTVPHAYASIDCEIDSVMNFRKKMKDVYGVNVSVNDFILKAASCALRDVPEANHFWDKETKSPKPNASIDISVAVATDAGLITPIVNHVNTKGLTEVNREFKSLVARARANKLKPEEFQGGSFTISNLGGFGIDHFTAVINPPQACIMAVGQGRLSVLSAQEGAGKSKHQDQGKDKAATKDKLRLATLMNVTLSSDRRILDEATAALFLQAFQQYMHEPELLVL